MKTIDSYELYEFFRQFRFALNGDTGAENFMLRQGKAYQVYQAAVAHINNVHREGTEGFTKIAFGLDDVVCLQGGEAMVMKMRASAAKGRSGWNDREDCPTELLQCMLVEHVAKGDPLDVMVIANMLRHRGDATSAKVLYEDRPAGRDAELHAFKLALNNSGLGGRCDIDALYSIYLMGRQSVSVYPLTQDVSGLPG